MLLWQPELFSGPGLSSMVASVLVSLFYPSSSDSPPFQLFGSLPKNPNSPTSRSQGGRPQLNIETVVSLSFPTMPGTLFPPSRDPQLHVHIFPLRSIAVIRTPNLAQARGLWLYTVFLPYGGLEGSTKVTFTHRSTLTTLCISTNTFWSPTFISGN